MATFWENDAHSVYCMFSLYFDIVISVISRLGFEGENLVLIAPVLDHCLSFFFESLKQLFRLHIYAKMTSFLCILTFMIKRNFVLK